MAKKKKKYNQDLRIEDINERLAAGENLRDIAGYYGMSCRAVCRLVGVVPEEVPEGSYEKPTFKELDDFNLD